MLLCNHIWAWNGNTPLTYWDSLSCDDLPTSMSNNFFVPGHTILHELMHWYAETKKATAQGGCGEPLTVTDYGTDVGATQTATGIPTDGYGAYNCKKLNDRPDLDPKRNADSYAWLAMEAWLANKCPGHTILDPLPNPTPTPTPTPRPAP